MRDLWTGLPRLSDKGGTRGREREMLQIKRTLCVSIEDFAKRLDELFPRFLRFACRF